MGTRGDAGGFHDRGKVLLEALAAINGERQDQYGNPEDSMDLIAGYWGVYLTRHLGVPVHLTGKDAAIMMVLLKLARRGLVQAS